MRTELVAPVTSDSSEELGTAKSLCCCYLLFYKELHTSASSERWVDRAALKSALRLINVAITTLLQKQQVKGWDVPLLIMEHLSYSCNCLCEHQSLLQIWTWFNFAAVSQTRNFSFLHLF